jgi:hypothetical protein
MNFSATSLTATAFQVSQDFIASGNAPLEPLFEQEMLSTQAKEQAAQRFVAPSLLLRPRWTNPVPLKAKRPVFPWESPTTHPGK